ncbi:MAG: YtxH domain-containing protein [Anaerolineae bacterium]
MRILRISGGLLLGALVGVGLVMLFTPRSGVETRRLIEDRVEAILDEGRQAAEARRIELTAQFEALKRPDLAA